MTFNKVAPDQLVGLIGQRIAALESLAMDVIRESGANYTDAEIVFDTGFALAEDFEDAGYVEYGQRLIAATLNYIEKLLNSNFDKYKKELKKINFTDETYVALKEQSSTFEELINTGFQGFKPYKEAAEQALKEGKTVVCKKNLKANGIKSSGFDKKIYIGEKGISLLDLAQDIYNRGHRIVEFSKKGFLKSYELTIQDTYGIKSNFILKADKLISSDSLKVTKRIEETGEKKIEATQWQEYITKLTRVPSGKTDEQGIRECDILAADPHDHKKLTDGVDLDKEEINTEEYFDYAIEACIAAAEAAPEDPRQQYQLGRLLWHVGEIEAATDRFSQAADSGYAAALFYKAETLWNNSDDHNSFVDALELYEEAGKKGYERGAAMVKELNPDGFNYFREIPAPTEEELTAMFAGGNVPVDAILMIANYETTGIKIKDCFQESATDFSCELQKVMECKIEKRRGKWDGDPFIDIMSFALQLPCSFNNDFTMFMTFRKTNDGWENITEADPGEYFDMKVIELWNSFIGTGMTEMGY